MPIAALDQNFVFKSPGHGRQPSQSPPQPTEPTLPAPPDPLQALVGTWVGTGFNAIWRPTQQSSGSDHVLMLSMTKETLNVTRIAGTIPNRGLLQGDIAMTGVTYMDQISDIDGNGLHIEPGIWAVVPTTNEPDVPQSVVRMASIPHGSVILAQGTASAPTSGPPTIPSADLIPTNINGGAQQDFPERQVAQPAQFRLPADPLPPEFTQQLLDDPNTLLSTHLANLTVSSTTALTVDTRHQPVPGGGTANTAFLAGTDPTNQAGNASANQVSATFWIETVEAQGDQPAFMQLQYTQTVQLDFGPLHWPHLTVATLRQISTGPTPAVPAPPPVQP